MFRALINSVLIVQLCACATEKEDLTKDKILNACVLYGSFCQILYGGSVESRDAYNNCIAGRDGVGQIPPLLPGCGLYSEYKKNK
jgi:hypothetical protein